MFRRCSAKNGVHYPQNGFEMRDFLKSLTRSLGYEIRKVSSLSERRPIDFIRSRGIDVVIDVGANVGQYAERLRSDGYTGSIVSAEPVRAIYDILAARAAGHHKWQVLNLAFGEKTGTTEINVSDASVFSSLNSTLPTAADLFPQSKVIRQETINVARLDNLFAGFPKGRAFLKIDTQGYERQVIAGAGRCISEFLGVQMELSIIHLYEGTWQFHEAIACMGDLGFEISTIIPVNFDPNDPMALLEVDCIFRKCVKSSR